MKKTAFLQACVILALLLASWILLLNKLQKTTPADPAPIREETADQEAATGQTKPPDRDLQQGSSTREAEDLQEIPAGWMEWIAYLDAVGSPGEMRYALEALKQSLDSLPPTVASLRIQDFLQSGADRQTGLAFQTGPERQIRASASLRAMLLAWLLEYDAPAAAALAVEELDHSGTGLLPDVYVVHLRNYALGTADSPAVANSRLKAYFGQLIAHQPWRESPGSAIAESMDVAVYSEATEFVPQLARLLDPGESPVLRRAASLALERLVDRQPLKVLPQLLSTTAADGIPPRMRAGYYARLDSSLPEAAVFLDQYIRSPQVSLAEVVFFLESFPNLNLSYSHNLLSNNIPNTEPGGYIQRLEGALEHVRRWQRNPTSGELEEALSDVEIRLLNQLSGNP